MDEITGNNCWQISLLLFI